MDSAKVHTITEVSSSVPCNTLKISLNYQCKYEDVEIDCVHLLPGAVRQRPGLLRCRVQVTRCGGPDDGVVQGKLQTTQI